jgi:hypothetical protein
VYLGVPLQEFLDCGVEIGVGEWAVGGEVTVTAGVTTFAE